MRDGGYGINYGEMEYRRCGRSGLKLPAVSLGLWHNFGSAARMSDMRDMVAAALGCGIVHFDIANNYGPEPGSAEENFGRILRGGLIARRDELIISTKAGYTMWDGPYGDWGGRKYLIASLDASLKRLGLAYVDIFYHHRMDPETPLEETMGALDFAVKSGRALYAGLSNYDGATLRRAAGILNELRCPFVINQNRYSIIDRTVEKNGLLAAACEGGTGVIAFSPLAQGLLTGRYLCGVPSDSRAARDGRFLKRADLTEERMAQVRTLDGIAASRGQTLAQMALSWVLSRPGVTSVLIGASKPEQIVENARAAERAQFTAEELSAIDSAVLG